jgi:hypothetical protein
MAADGKNECEVSTLKRRLTFGVIKGSYLGQAAARQLAEDFGLSARSVIGVHSHQRPQCAGMQT